MSKVYEIKAVKTQQFTTRIAANNLEEAKQMADREVDQAYEEWFVFTGMKIEVAPIDIMEKT